jgi:hypothetical protein
MQHMCMLAHRRSGVRGWCTVRSLQRGGSHELSLRVHEEQLLSTLRPNGPGSPEFKTEIRPTCVQEINAHTLTSNGHSDLLRARSYTHAIQKLHNLRRIHPSPGKECARLRGRT